VRIEGSVAPIRTDRATIGAAITFRDVTIREWREQQLRQAQRVESASRLAATLTADFTNRLAAIQNQSATLLRQLGDYSPARQAIAEIHKASSEAGQFLTHLADFSSRSPSHPTVFSLNSVLRRMSRLIQSSAGPKIETALRLQRELGKIRADTAQIEQTVMMLVQHACASMREGGHLLIETGGAPIAEDGAEYLMLAVSDDGPGYEPSTLDRLFEPVIDDPSGSGLALATVHSVITEHGGYVTARSRQGEGCRIEVFLPRWEEAPVSNASPAATVLLVDSRDAVRAEVHNFFEAHGYNLLEATDSAEALALVEVHEGPIDLVISEIPMPELSMRHPQVRVLTPEETMSEQTLLKRVEEALVARA
jgi:signal transduction histidine kinase